MKNRFQIDGDTLIVFLNSHGSLHFGSTYFDSDQLEALQRDFPGRLFIDGDGAIRGRMWDGRMVCIHRWICHFPESQRVAHIDNDKMNNRLSNLRVVAYRRS